MPSVLAAVDRTPARGADDLQQRPGQPVHEPPVSGAPASERRADQHGRQGPRPGRHLQGALVADSEVRRRLSAESICMSTKTRAPPPGACGLLRVLQPGTAPSVAELPDACRSVLRPDLTAGKTARRHRTLKKADPLFWQWGPLLGYQAGSCETPEAK